MKRQLTQAAQVAKIIKADLKKMGIKCTARSSNYSMGCSVDIGLTNMDPATVKKINEMTSKYQYGHFDGMTDMYEHSNSRDDIPQCKHLFINNKYTADFYQLAYDWFKEKYNYDNEPWPEKYEDLSFTDRAWDRPIQEQLYQVLNGSWMVCGDDSPTFWEQLQQKQEKPKAATTTASGGQITEHTHTKKGFQMFIVQLSERVSKEEFKSLLDDARAAGGWYSRKWGASPAGFAFKERAKAEKFLSGLTGSAETEGTDSPEPKPPKPTGPNPEKLRTLADKMQSAIDNKLADRMTNTPKRIKEANAARAEGHRLARTQKLLRAVADRSEAGTLPAELNEVTTKKRAYELMRSKMELCENSFHSYYVETGEPGADDATTRAAWDLIGKQEKDPAEEIKRKIEALQFSKIPGYFPTPAAVVDKMVKYADIEPGHSVLEPSAGSGAICQAVKDNTKAAKIYAYEINHSLYEILKARGFSVDLGDFLKVVPLVEKYDRVLMNPPFEAQQDIQHIKHAFKNWLKTGGVLVAICSESVFFRDTKKNREFNRILDESMVHCEKLEAGTFKEAGTNVATRLVVLKK